MLGGKIFQAAAITAVLAACANARTGAGPDGDGGDGAVTTDAPADGASPDDGPPPPILFVSIDGHDSNTGRDPAQPLRHVAVAIERAGGCVPGPCAVRIAEGLYQESIALAAGVDLEGGWAPGFATRDLVVYPVVLTSELPVTVTAEALIAATVVDGVTLRGADLSARTDGSSSIALRVRDTGDAVQLRSVRIEAGRGARGAPGDDGALTSCLVRGGDGGTAYDCGGNSGRLGDAGGDPASASAPGTSGGSNCPNACPLVGSDGISGGGVGGNGNNGGAGGSGVPATDDDGRFEEDVWVAAAGEPGRRGAHGTGGSGGGSGGSKRFRVCFGCGTLPGGRGGDGAPGGCGGGGGATGGGGGGAFGVVIIRATLSVEAVAIIGGLGGAGGVGGDGHPGGPGSTDGSAGRQGAPSQQCGAITYRAGAGAAGGIGGHGGHGGGGAGGAGGPSIGVAVVAGGLNATGEPGANVIEIGTGGLGGAGGTGAVTAPVGPVGRAANLVDY